MTKAKPLNREAVLSLHEKMERAGASKDSPRPNLTREEVRVVQSLLASYSKKLRPARFTLSYFIREAFAQKDSQPMSPTDVAKFALEKGWKPKKKNAKALPAGLLATELARLSKVKDSGIVKTAPGRYWKTK